MTSLTRALTDADRSEQRLAVRALLASPLLSREADPDAYVLVARHREALVRWFGQHFGWVLTVDIATGFARLLKVAQCVDGTHAATLSNGRLFDRRRYVLLALCLAALDRVTAQTTLRRLADDVTALSADTPDVEPFDTTVYADRRAFVDALKWLVDRGVLVQRDGDTEPYAQGAGGDALFDLRERVYGHLLAAPVSPAIAGTPEAMRGEVYVDTEEGRRLKARYAVMRRLVDEPVVYLEELDEREREWLEHALAYVATVFEGELGLRIERRREGLAVVDPEGRLTDLRFPDGDSTAKHAALLLAEQLTRVAREEPSVDVVLKDDLHAMVTTLVADYGERCGWRREYLAAGGAARLTDDAVGILEAMGLVRREGAGVRPMPAIARFAPASPETTRAS